MGYINKNLSANEELVYTAKVHWFIFLPPALLLFLGISFLNSEPLYAGEPSYIPLIGFILTLVALFKLIGALITRFTTELGITTKRVIAKVGLIRRNTVELNHSKVESFQVEQSVFGRILGFGTITIQGTGGGKTPIKGIDSPLAFRREAQEIVDKTGG